LTYEAVWHAKVKNDLASLGKDDASRVIRAVRERLARDPLGLGKPLKGVFKGLYRYRIGVYRIIYAVDHAERRLIVLHVRHRKNAYR